MSLVHHGHMCIKIKYMRLDEKMQQWKNKYTRISLPSKRGRIVKLVTDSESSWKTTGSDVVHSTVTRGIGSMCMRQGALAERGRKKQAQTKCVLIHFLSKNNSEQRIQNPHVVFVYTVVFPHLISLYIRRNNYVCIDFLAENKKNSWSGAPSKNFKNHVFQCLNHQDLVNSYPFHSLSGFDAINIRLFNDMRLVK